MKHGYLLLAAPRPEELSGLMNLWQTQLNDAQRVYVYALHDGVAWACVSALQSLRSAGLVLFGCAYAARRRSLPLADNATWCGLSVLADVLADTDLFQQPGLPMAGSHKQVVVTCRQDPRKSPDVAEAVRVAAGLQSSGKVTVSLALYGDAALVLRDSSEVWIDDDILQPSLALARELGVLFHQDDRPVSGRRIVFD
jgi:hypothetical protein